MSSTKSTESTTVVLDTPSTGARKLLKIVSYSEGGFAILTPYHSARSGLLMKMPVDYSRKGEIEVASTDCTTFTADDRVKLSFHKDGLVQFSGENPGKIISGVDQFTG